jgi:hypothetical protein
LNRRRQPFQGCALPPELPGHVTISIITNASLAALFFRPINLKINLET